MTATAACARRVLVVEDNEDSRATLRALLELWGHQVQEAADGVEGVRKALDWRPEAAVVDIGMPLLDGYGVARRVRAALGSRILLVALTAYRDRQRALEAGFDEHLVKPAEPEHLARLLQQAPPAS
jgi:CheY-like chemotaxis protein